MTDSIDFDSIDPAANSTTPIDETVVSMDIDGDGIPDTVLSQADVNGDGIADIEGLAIDVDGDGVADIEGVAIDSDGDGIADVDILATNDAAQIIWGDLDGASPSDLSADMLGAMTATCDELIFPGYADLLATCGTPEADMAFWAPQDDPMSCAVATTNMMFMSMGLDPGEEAIADTFQAFGVYDPVHGSKPAIIDDAINIIAATKGLDIQAETFSRSDIDDLEAMLERGVRPLIAVDGAELYAGDDERALNDLGLLPDAPHAVQLTGIEHTPNGDFAVINDPGVPDGAGVLIPMDTFKDAWDDMGNSGVAMSDAATMASLDAHEGRDEAAVQLGGREPLTRDEWGYEYRGNSRFPISGPGLT